MNFPKISAALAAFALSAAALPAAAATSFQMDYQDSGSVFGTPNLSESVRIYSDDHNGGVRAGPFRVTSERTGDLVAFCVDLAQYMANGQQYEANDGLFSAARVDLLDRLFTTYYAGMDTRREGAAMQLAIWEITHDTGLDLSGGDFSAAYNAGAISLAQSWLDGLGQAQGGGYRISFFESGTSQDLVAVSPVPLPAGMLLLGTALGAFGVARRRKSAA